jgi:hypothetical protein
MEDKRKTKRSCSPSKEGSSSLSGGSTPPPAPLGTSLPSGSPLEISRHPCSLVFEQGNPSEKVPVVDLFSSSDENGLIPNTAWGEEFARMLFGDFNHGVLGPPDDGKVIILNDSDEEEEVHEEQATDVEAEAKATPSSIVKSPTPTASAADATTADKGRSPDQVIGDSSSGRDEASGCTKEFKNNDGCALLHHNFFCKEEWRW